MKKLENNWKYKTLELLEKDKWPEPSYDSYLIRRVAALRRIPLSEFSVEDTRIMIGQRIGLDYLIPLAIGELSVNLFAEGDFYEGDLLKAVLTIESSFWKANNSHWLAVNELIKDRLDEIDEYDIETAIFLSVTT